MEDRRDLSDTSAGIVIAIARDFIYKAGIMVKIELSKLRMDLLAHHIKEIIGPPDSSLDRQGPFPSYICLFEILGRHIKAGCVPGVGDDVAPMVTAGVKCPPVIKNYTLDPSVKWKIVNSPHSEV